MKREIWKKGDVIAVETAGSFHYLHYLGRIARLGDIFAVLRMVSASKSADAEAIVRHGAQYFLCSIRNVLTADPRFTRVGRVTPVHALPLLRRAQLNGWAIIEPLSGRQLSFMAVLDDATATLPIEELLPPGVIIERLSSGWLPQDDRADLVTYLKKAGTRGEVSTATFFVEFTSASSKSNAVTALRSDGFTTSEHRRLEIRASIALEPSTDVAALKRRVISCIAPFGGVLSGEEMGLK